MSADKAQLFLDAWQFVTNWPAPDAEYRFHPVRKWRFDFAFPQHRIYVEVEGNAWRVAGGGRHMQDSDLEKYNAAALMGWRGFRFSPGMLKRDPVGCVEMVVEALHG
jgi:very-short-patch-repair endonuclease